MLDGQHIWQGKNIQANGCLDSGALSEHELGTALVNGDYTVFDPHTVKMMIRYEKTCRLT